MVPINVSAPQQTSGNQPGIIHPRHFADTANAALEESFQKTRQDSAGIYQAVGGFAKALQDQGASEQQTKMYLHRVGMRFALQGTPAGHLFPAVTRWIADVMKTDALGSMIDVVAKQATNEPDLEKSIASFENSLEFAARLPAGKTAREMALPLIQQQHEADKARDEVIAARVSAQDAVNVELHVDGDEALVAHVANGYQYAGEADKAYNAAHSQRSSAIYGLAKQAQDVFLK